MPFFARQCGYWEAKITQCVDMYTNYWLKCQKERPFWRPVEEVLQWEFIDEPLPLPPPPTIEPTYFSDLDREIAAEAPAVITPTRETPAREIPAVEPSAVEPSAVEPPTGQPPSPAAAEPKDDMPLSPDYFGQVPLSQPLSQLTASDLQAASAALMAIGF